MSDGSKWTVLNWVTPKENWNTAKAWHLDYRDYTVAELIEKNESYQSRSGDANPLISGNYTITLYPQSLLSENLFPYVESMSMSEIW